MFALKWSFDTAALLPVTRMCLSYSLPRPCSYQGYKPKSFLKIKSNNTFLISSLCLDIFLIACLEGALGLLAQLMGQLSNFCIKSLAQKAGLFTHPSPAAALPAHPGSSAGHVLCPAGMAHPRGIKKHRDHPDWQQSCSHQWAAKRVLNQQLFPYFLYPCHCTYCA